MLFLTALASLFAAVTAKDSRTFAVLHFYGDGPLVEARMDPIIQPGEVSSHVHTIMGGSNFNENVTGEELMSSNCSTALIKNDHSAYWYPKLYFQDPKNESFEPVDLFYMNVYYFFEATNDNISAFPVGLQMVSGNAMTRTPPGTNGTLQLDPSQGTIQPTQWTCPRTSFNPPSWPVGSDGQHAGQQDPNNQGSGTGFPFAECDGYASPLRMDLHFPSCYDPSAGLTDYETNMQFPVNVADGMQDCPEGWTHTPHIFFEVYWNTPLFADRWTPNDGYQPFVLSDGDLSGYSAHGDFIAAWDEETLQTIIDTCNAGDSGMDKCPQVIGGLADTTTSCNINSPVDEQIYGVLENLPGDNPLSGWSVNNNQPPPMPGGGGSGSVSSAAVSSAAAASSPAAAYPSSAPSPSEAETSTLAGGDGVEATSTSFSVPAASASPDPTTMSITVSAASPKATPAQKDEDGSDVVTVVDVVTHVVTVYATVTVDSDAAPTNAAKVKRGADDLHNHVLRHRIRPFNLPK